LSMGPLLSLGQFTRFMTVIQKLGQRVELEHSRYLRDHQRLDDRMSSPGPSMTPDFSAGVSFEQLVNRKENRSLDNATVAWDGNGWESLLGNTAQEQTTPVPITKTPSSFTIPQNTTSLQSPVLSDPVTRWKPNAERLSQTPSHNQIVSRSKDPLPMTPNYNIVLNPTTMIPLTPLSHHNGITFPDAPHLMPIKKENNQNSSSKALPVDWADFDPLK